MNTQEDLIRFIKSNFGYEVTMETRFEDLPDFDSLRIVEMIMEVETEYDIDIPDEDVEKLETIQDLYQIVFDYS